MWRSDRPFIPPFMRCQACRRLRPDHPSDKGVIGTGYWVTIVAACRVTGEQAGIQLGLRKNLAQFTLLVVVNAFVGAMVGIERTILPLLAEREFHLAARSAALSFIVVFGVTKALTN